MFKIHVQPYLQNRTTTLKCLVSSRIHGTTRLDPILTPKSPIAAQVGKRGGQDLTNRDLRLSKSIRQKQAFFRAGKPETFVIDPSKNEALAQGESDTRGPSMLSAKSFRGMVIPEKPKPPESDECCMSGCAICVYDLYLTSLESYREAIASLRSKLLSENVPVAVWPGEIRPNEGGKIDGSIGEDPLPELDVSMSAFAHLERSLRESQKSS